MQIKLMRELAGVSLKELAARAGVSFVTAYRWDTGEDSPAAKRLPIIADILKCSIDDLYGRDTAVS